MSKPSTLEARVAALPCWQGRVTLSPLKGGLSNTSFIVDDGGTRYVARCGADMPVHHVVRERERAASVAAHGAGLAPELVHAEAGIMVLRYVEARPLTEADLRTDLPRIVALLAACHRDVGRRLAGAANAFWVFHVIRDYARVLAAADGARAAECARYAALADALERQQTPLPIVFGHHDLLPGNLLDDGERLWLIDWEYAGFGTAMFDLANLATNGRFAPADDHALLEAYFHAPATAALRRAFDAMKVASALREATWAMVSAIYLDAPGADYRLHADDFLTRTAAVLAQFEDAHGALRLGA